MSSFVSQLFDLKKNKAALAMMFLVMSLIGVMLIPLPAFLLDAFLALNLVLSMTILFIALSLQKGLQLSSFPTLLLISTLFRLSLNISSTRMILSKGHAGQMIQSFSQFVTSGHLIVGVILFVVMTIIQLIVVSKGAERVAEVSARFALDAMPGKQMSIDADLRAGLIDSEKAGQRRNELVKESKFYGSMDGAMKFVKGDVIAGVVITLINALAGFCMGYFERGFSLTDSLAIYTKLTIGDGLVAQIPAILISISAGLIVTRVAGEDQENSLSEDIQNQILSSPFVLAGVGVSCLILSLMPGFPKMVFILFAAVLMGFAFVLAIREHKKKLQKESIEDLYLDSQNKSNEWGTARPFVLEVSPHLYHQLKEDVSWSSVFREAFPRLKQALNRKYGVPYPDLEIAVNEELGQNYYQILIFDIPVDQGTLWPQQSLVKDWDEQSLQDHLKTAKTTETAHGTPVLLFHKYQIQSLQEKGVTVVRSEEAFLRHVVTVLQNNADHFIGIQQVKTILNQLESYSPELVREVIPRMISLNKLTSLTKRLVEERVPIRDFRFILENLADMKPEEKSALDLAEMLRIRLRRILTHRFTNNRKELECFLLDPNIEALVQNNLSKDDGELFLDLKPQDLQAIIDSVQAYYKLHGEKFSSTVILTEATIRRALQKILKDSCANIHVISYSEIEPQVKICPKDTISWTLKNETSVS